MTSLKVEMDIWVKDMQTRNIELEELIEHNYQLIKSLREEIEVLKIEVNALKIINIVMIRGNR